MRFSQVSLLFTSVIGLGQGLIVPETSRAVKSSSTRTLFLRDDSFSCPVDGEDECTSCPDILFNGDSLSARVDIPMNAIGSGSWKGGDVLESHGLSVCTVMALWDKNHWIMAHIPPAREGNDGGLAATGQDLVDEYKSKFDDRYSDEDWDEPVGYLLVSKYLDGDLKTNLEDWFKDRDIEPTVETYGPEDVMSGSGNLVISREGQDYPPAVVYF
ncbi:hypothetical protein F5B22DRAFT_611263 [Xylaria bambusicola]|uniref:uncharacterized protein n=1 Tax=Xylaria bambusicola TaxID=326684 RepID=UPI0020077150|nr:uncharacterized protein F5B22DRAFT_611263 [Xylaria bambusicola]KAI0514358.1 hypothetical protein F5B22DRAFT_611263 [Xylaria bambusicola]